MNTHPARLIGAALIAAVVGLGAPAAAETSTEGAARLWDAPPGFIPCISPAAG